MEYNIYLDMDGVLSDFDKHFEKEFGKHPLKYKTHVINFLIKEKKINGNAAYKIFREQFWKIIDARKNFWSHMTPIKDYKKLVKYLKKYKNNVKVLTAVPEHEFQTKKAIEGKKYWIKKHIPYPVEVLFVKLNAQNHCISPKGIFAKNDKDILIDDNISYVNDWKRKGGTAILYINAEDTIKNLKTYLEN